jgi:hypothetical protein
LKFRNEMFEQLDGAPRLARQEILYCFFHRKIL